MTLGSTLSESRNPFQGELFPELAQVAGPLHWEHKRFVTVLDSAGLECFGCDRINPYWGRERRSCALHTATGLKRQRRKGLEPSRRLSETTGPRSPSAFRVVVRQRR